MPAALRLSRPYLIVICALMAICAWQAPGWAETPKSAQLTILHTNDIHGHLFPFDYSALGAPETNVGGAARRATLIRSLRTSAKHPVITMDAGDVFTRGPLADLLGVPDFEVMNAVPYDIMTLGNNEFKGAGGIQGQKVMLERIKQARFAIVSANVSYKSTGETMVPACKVFALAGGARIGVFGLTAPRVATYAQAEGLVIADPIETAKKVVSELRKSCDLVIGLTHIGYPLDLQLAASVPGIDVIIGGDSHTWVPQPTLVKDTKQPGPTWWVGGTLVCQDGEWGKCVGKLDLALRRAEDSRLLVSAYKGALVNVDSSIKPAADIQRILDRHSKPYLKPIGKLADAVPTSGAAAWVAERMRQAAGAQVGVEPKDGIENGLRAGTVTTLDIRRMFPFVNGVVKLTVTGKQLADYVSSVDAGLAGIEARGDEFFIDGAKVNPSANYTLAVESYYAATQPTLAGAQSQALGKTTSEVVTNYITSLAK